MRYNLTTLLERDWYGDIDEMQVDVTVHTLSPKEEGKRLMLHFTDVVTDVIATESYLSLQHVWYGNNDTHVAIPISSVLYITYTAKDRNVKVSS
jgi:hypothetical protein